MKIKATRMCVVKMPKGVNDVPIYPGVNKCKLDPSDQLVAEQLRVFRDDLGIISFDEKLPVCAIEMEIGTPEQMEKAKQEYGKAKPVKKADPKAKPIKKADKQLFDDLIKRVKALHGKELQIHAVGNYPVKANTKVSHVAKWQNDGTATIKPAYFVEAAENKNRWEKMIGNAVFEFINGDRLALEAAGFLMAKQTNKAESDSGRVDTGRLKQSFRHRIK